MIAFVDNALLLACAKTLMEANDKLKDMMVCPSGGLNWSHTHHCSFEMDKFGVMGLTRKREPNPGRRPHTRPASRAPIVLQGVEIMVIVAHKFLGVIVDQELHWKEQVNYTLQKGTKWVAQYCRLVRLTKGVSAKYMR